MSAERLHCTKCTRPATHQAGTLCVQHYRMVYMRVQAKRYGKAVPSYQELERLVSELDGLKCPECRREMNWLSKEGTDTVATLQHYRDGTFGIVCLSCNSRHGRAPGDSFRDMPKDHKYCPHCKTFKPESAYGLDRHKGRPGPRQFTSWCLPCRRANTSAWEKKNREHRTAYMREYRAKRKAEGRPVPSGGRRGNK